MAKSKLRLAGPTSEPDSASLDPLDPNLDQIHQTKLDMDQVQPTPIANPLCIV